MLVKPEGVDIVAEMQLADGSLAAGGGSGIGRGHQEALLPFDCPSPWFFFCFLCFVFTISVRQIMRRLISE